MSGRCRWVAVSAKLIVRTRQLLSFDSSARLSIFIGDSSRVEQQVLPGEKFLETHGGMALMDFRLRNQESKIPTAFTIGIPIWLIVRTGRSSSKPSAVEP